MQVLIIGGGISGLACAWRLKHLGVEATVLEQSNRPGGVIATQQQDGFQFELGPQSFLSTPAILEIVNGVGLHNELLRADSHAPRFVLRNGNLQTVPMAPPGLLTTSLLSVGTKLRLLSEPLRKSSPPADDESLATFVRRKFGNDLLDNLAGPFVSGIYAGDPEKLSLRAAFPNVHRWEKEFGSVLRGAMKNRPPKGTPRSGLCSFREGMAALPSALAKSLGEHWKPGVRVNSLHRPKANGHSIFEVKIEHRGLNETVSPDAVVVATPAGVSGTLLETLSPALHEELSGIEYAPVAVVSQGYRREQLSHSLDGFGFLIPRSEGKNILGTVWSSSLFPGRAPNGMVSLASFAGGATNPQIVQQSEEAIAGVVENELSKILGIRGEPVARTVSRISRAIPQYNLGHCARLTAISESVAHIPGLFLTGNYFDGPAVGACIEHAFAVADRVARHLAAAS